MATKGKFSLFTESDCHTFARVREAEIAYKLLFQVDPQVYVRGLFQTTSSWPTRVQLPWTPVYVVSTGFMLKSGEYIQVVPGQGFQFALFQKGQSGPDGVLHG